MHGMPNDRRWNEVWGKYLYVMIFLALCAAAVFAFPFLQERQRRPLDRGDRKAATGAFVKLSDGQTHYHWSGRARGPIIVAVHGLTTPSVVWGAITPALTALGFRVLSYDLYGRGYSDAPRRAYTLDFYTRQLDELLAHLGIGEDITLMGYSMGGSIVTAFAASQPERVARVFLVAPAGMVMHETTLEKLCRKVPVLGDWAHGLIMAEKMRRGLAAKQGEIAEALRLQLSRRGYLPAVLSSRRHALAATLEAEHRKLGREDVPVFAFFGREDQTIPMAAMGALAQWNRAARQEDIAGAGHGLPYEQPEALIEKIKMVLRELY